MKAKLIAAGLAVAGLAVAGGANAQVYPYKAHVCSNCHDAEKKKAGPSLKDIAAKGGKTDEIVAKMKEGKGHPKVNKPEADLKAAVDKSLGK